MFKTTLRSLTGQLQNTIIVSLLLITIFAVPSHIAFAHDCFGDVGSKAVSIAQCTDAGACLDSSGQACPGAQTSAKDKVNSIITVVVNAFSILVGVAAVIMIIVGGLKYITSSGESNNINSAKNTILYAIIGLVIVALAQIIVKFVLAKAK